MLHFALLISEILLFNVLSFLFCFADVLTLFTYIYIHTLPFTAVNDKDIFFAFAFGILAI